MRGRPSFGLSNCCDDLVDRAWLSASGSPRSDWTRKTMTSAVEYPGVVTTSNCAEGGSHSLSAGIFVTVAVYRIAGRPEMVKFVGPL